MRVSSERYGTLQFDSSERVLVSDLSRFVLFCYPQTPSASSQPPTPPLIFRKPPTPCGRPPKATFQLLNSNRRRVSPAVSPLLLLRSLLPKFQRQVPTPVRVHVPLPVGRTGNCLGRRNRITQTDEGATIPPLKSSLLFSLFLLVCEALASCLGVT